MKKMNISLAALVLLTTNIGYSYPARNINCSHIENKIKDPNGHKNNVELLFNERCDIAYVTPPIEGVKEVKLEPIGSLNLRECRDIYTLQDTNSSWLNILRSYSRQRELIHEDIKDKAELQAQYRKALQSEEQKKIRYIEEQEKVKEDILHKEKEITDLKNGIVNCSDLNCEHKKERLKTLEEKVANNKELERNISTRINEINREISSYERKIGSIDHRRVDDIKESVELAKKIKEISDLLRKQISVYTTRYGATIQLSLDLNWEKTINDLKKNNTDLNLTFEKLPITKSEILINPFDIKENLKREDPVIWRSLPNEVFTPITEAENPNDLNTLPEGILFIPKVNLTINMVGACSFYDQESQSMVEDRYEAFKAKFLSTITYEYAIKENVDYKYSFNIHKAIDAVADHFKKNGSLEVNKLTTDYGILLPNFNLERYNACSTKECLEGFKRQKQFSLLRNLASNFAKSNVDYQSVDIGNCSGNQCLSINLKTNFSTEEIEVIATEIKSQYPSEIINKESNGNIYSNELGMIYF